MMEKCPVCGSPEVQEILSLDHQPIYQHPVVSADAIKEPYFKDLTYFFCKKCEHCFQKTPDISVLEKLYQDHYYTPRPPDIGVQFQNQFIQTLLERFKVLTPSSSILEVGCSAGEMLTKINRLFPDTVLAGFEPNTQTAERASASGFLVYGQFFTKRASQKIKRKFDLIFHRHVIEHVFDFEDFFQAHQNVSHSETILIVETPCLNWSIHHQNMAGFHVEHVHVFSIMSLKRLLENHNWYLNAYEETSNGHLIALFTRVKSRISVPGVGNPFQLSLWIEKNKNILEKAVHGKKLALWGAGSGGVKVMNYFNVCPDIIVDSNPDKAGKIFVGYAHLKIANADAWIEQECNNSRSWLILVASTYFEEIQERLGQAGWEGDVLKPYSPL